MKEDSMYEEDIENLKSAEDLVNQLDDLDNSWAQTAASPPKQMTRAEEVRTGNTGDGSEIVPMGHMEESLTPIRIGRVEKAAARRTSPLFERIEKAAVRRVSPRRTGDTTKNRETKEKGMNLKSVMMKMSEKNVAVRVDI